MMVKTEMNAMGFIWRNGYRATGDATVFGAYYDQLRQQHGGELDAETLVKEAKSKSCPIHDSFEWDNKIAGHEHRLTQARQMMAAIAVYEETPEGPTQPIRYTVAVTPRVVEPEAMKKAYVPMKEALADAERRQEVVRQAFRDARAWETRYRGIKELAGVFEALDKAEIEAFPPTDIEPPADAS
jgi:hypothetical protein